MTELNLVGGNAEKAKAEGVEPYDLDIDIKNGVSKDLCNSSGAEKERAYVAAYTKRGSVPTNESSGVDWVDFVSGERPFTEIVNQISQNLNNLVGFGKFSPQLLQDGQNLKFSLVDLRS
jgi:hypothetical protein